MFSSKEGTCLCREGKNNTLSFISPLIEEEAYVFNEKELRELLSNAWDAGKVFENAGWDNQEYMLGLPEIPKEQYINNLLK